jgi:hypothetical protein
MSTEPTPRDDGLRVEIKPSFSVRYLVFFIFVSIVASILSFFVPKLLTNITEQPDTKQLTIANFASQNLAAFPSDVSSKLELSVLLSPTDRRPLKSLYGYQVRIDNWSKVNVAENIEVFLQRPPSVELIDPPTIEAASNLLRLSTLASKKTIEGGGLHFNIDQLAPGQGITFAYTGFSHELIAGVTFLDAEVRAKGWSVVPAQVESGVSYTTEIYGAGRADYSEPIRNDSVIPRAMSFHSKKLADYDAWDIVTLFLIIVSATAVLIGIALLAMRFVNSAGHSRLPRLK